jgi:hypothetical protein
LTDYRQEMLDWADELEAADASIGPIVAEAVRARIRLIDTGRTPKREERRFLHSEPGDFQVHGSVTGRIVRHEPSPQHPSNRAAIYDLDEGL